MNRRPKKKYHPALLVTTQLMSGSGYDTSPRLQDKLLCKAGVETNLMPHCGSQWESGQTSWTLGSFDQAKLRLPKKLQHQVMQKHIIPEKVSRTTFRPDFL